MREAFIPKNTTEVFLKMKKWDALRGSIKFDGDREHILWNVANDLTLVISTDDYEGYIEVFDSPNIKKMPLTHWHPATESLYDELKAINAGTYEFAYVKTLFGKKIIYIGVKRAKRRRFLFRKIYFLGNE